MGSTPTPQPTYGWIGIGNMGYGMAMNVAAKATPGSALIICDVDAAQMDRFVAEAPSSTTVKPVKTPREVAEKADIILTSLPAATHVSAVYTHPATGLLAHPPSKPTLFIDTSTIEVAASLRVREAVEAASADYAFLDAPVSGGMPVAARGALTSMAGGAADVFDRARPVIEMYCVRENVFLCGEAGAGLATKQINNYCAFVSFLGLCEGMNTGIRYGLDPKVLGDIINRSSGMSWNSLHMNPVKGVVPGSSANRDFAGGFPTELAAGVMGMAVALQKDVGAKSVFGPAVTAVYARGVKSDKCQGKECRSVWRLFAENDGHDLD